MAGIDLPGRHENMYQVNFDRYEPKALVIDLVRQCTERCKHCVVAAAPDRRERLGPGHAKAAIADAARNGFASVSFYGGEPFVAKQDLYESVMDVLGHGMHAQIMTNGFWGRTPETARQMFARLHALRPNSDEAMSVNVSTDEFHTQVPHESIGNIVAAWAEAPDGIDLNLAIGDSGLPDYVQNTMNTILDTADARLLPKGMRTCDHHDPLSGNYGVAVVDKFLTIPNNLSPGECLDLFGRESMLPADVIDVMHAQEFKTFNQVFLFLRNNGLALLVQTPENKAAGVCQMGRYKPNKIMQFRSYTINLFGAGRELQADAGLRRRIARAHEGSDISVNIHEYRSLLMLGNDNKFYASPIHLQHQVRPLGENTGDAIRGVINEVNEGECVSGILRMQDTNMAKMWLLTSGDHEGYDRFCALEQEGLIHEAFEVFLLSQKAMAALPKYSSLYRARYA